MFQVKMPAVRRKCRYQNAGGGILYYRHFHSHSVRTRLICMLDRSQVRWWGLKSSFFVRFTCFIHHCKAKNFLFAARYKSIAHSSHTFGQTFSNCGSIAYEVLYQPQYLVLISMSINDRILIGFQKRQSIDDKFCENK